MKKTLLLNLQLIFLFVLAFLPPKVYSQSCPNVDFSNGNFANWQGRTGSCCPINLPTAGIVPGRHTIVGAGVDPNTCGGLVLPPPGYAQAAQLGNSGTGAQAEGISYTFLVDPQSALFVYTYAVVMEDPSHTPAEQPRFEIQVRDQAGNIIPCTIYEISAGSGIPGFQNCGSVRWKDWTQVGVDLSGYIGQNVTIEMRTGDCSLGGHYGYGYIVGDCQPLEILVEYCLGDTVAQLTAPDGFASYQWSTGQTTQTISLLNPTPGVSTVSCQVTSVTGCQAVLSAVINPVIVTAGFTYTDNCGVVQFTDTTNVTGTNSVINQWAWDFDDAGATANTQNPSHQYGSAGTYDVTLIATSNIGCSDTAVVSVPVTQLPTASFSVPTNCGLTNTFSDSASVGGSSAITNYDWNFGDGNTGTGSPVTHTYANSGTWNIQLVVTNADGCTDTLVQPFTNRVYPTAAFNVAAVCEYDTAHFIDQSISGNATITNWDWQFTPAITSTNQNPDVLFPTNNTYNVQLIVLTNEGCTDTIVQAVNIWDAPVAAYTADSVCLGVGTTFNNTSAIGSGIISTYTWDYGDPAFPDNGLQNPIIVYNQDGTYNTQLIITSDHNCTDTAQYTLVVFPMPDIDFTVDTLTACYPFTADFTNTSVINTGSMTYTWDLGYGPTSSSTDESIMYPNVYNQYTVTLTATSDRGCDTSITRNNYITVYPKPVADFTADAPCLGDATHFQDLSSVSSGTLNYNWNFDEPTLPNSALQEPVAVYPADGSFNPVLIVTTNYGCTDTVTYPINIWPMPDIDFTAGPLVGCYPFMVDFTNNTTINSGSITTWSWDLGNGTGSAAFEPSIMYPNMENQYSISLTAISDHGCDTSITKTNYITVHPKPTASFTYTPTDLNVLETQIHVIDLSVLADNYLYTFGTGDMSTNDEPNYQYPADTGVYTIIQVVTTQYGCVDTADAIVHIKPTFTIYIPNTFTPNGDGLNDFFTISGIGLQNASMLIFDRWGENIASLSGSDPLSKGWDGKKSQADVKQDVYVYKISVVDLFGQSHEFIGQINLIR